MMHTSIEFIDLAAQRQRLGPAISLAMLRVVDHGGYIMGPEVEELEAELAAFCGAKHVISCASGTDALALVLRAKGVGPGDAVLCPTFTFAATAEAVAWLGATPICADVQADGFHLDSESVEAGIRVARDLRLNVVGVIPVDLFGQPAAYDAIAPICDREGLWMLCDAAQSFGSVYKGRKVGTLGLATATSFYPAKPLGCYGDGGAVFTDDDALADVVRSVRVHGQGDDKYNSIRIGQTGRLDTLQAAVLLEKLKIFPDEIEARNKIARRYKDGLADVATVPEVPKGVSSVWAQYTLRLGALDRDRFRASLLSSGVPTAVYYPKPLHLQTAYRAYPAASRELPVAERLAREVVSLPMHPYLTEELQDYIISAVRRAIAAQHDLSPHSYQDA